MFLKVNELAFMLLPIVNLFCGSKKTFSYKSIKSLKSLLGFFLLSVLFIVFILKFIYFYQGLFDSFKEIRLGIPIISSFMILRTGIRADLSIVWQVLLTAVGCSVIVSLLSIYITLPIYFNAEEGSDALNNSHGRILNSNASFGIIGLYLMFKDKHLWFNRGKLVEYASILSIIGLILTFNRTYLALLTVGFIYLSFKTFSPKNLVKIILIPTVFVGVFTFAYSNSNKIREQIDKRIFSIVFDGKSLKESTIENNRDVIYEGISQNVAAGYWVIGMPYEIPIFEKEATYSSDVTQLAVTDTSIANILLRFGIFPLLLVTLIFVKMFRQSPEGLFKFTLIIYLLASFNVDSLFRHNSVFFLIIIYLVTTSTLKKRIIYEK
jgi:hypothetical protein